VTEKKRPKRKRNRPKPPPKQKVGGYTDSIDWPGVPSAKIVMTKDSAKTMEDVVRYAKMTPGQRAQANVEMVFQQDESNAEYFIKSLANLLSVALGYQVDEYAINVRTTADPKSTVLHIRWVRDGKRVG
jgi:FlaG/FlaF family flagellin (archaellin)